MMMMMTMITTFLRLEIFEPQNVCCYTAIISEMEWKMSVRESPKVHTHPFPNSWNQLPVVVALDILRSALLFLCRFCGSFLNGLTSLGGSRLGCSLLCLLLSLLGHLPVVLVVAKVNQSLEEFRSRKCESIMSHPESHLRLWWNMQYNMLKNLGNQKGWQMSSLPYTEWPHHTTAPYVEA